MHKEKEERDGWMEEESGGGGKIERGEQRDTWRRRYRQRDRGMVHRRHSCMAHRGSERSKGLDENNGACECNRVGSIGQHFTRQHWVGGECSIQCD